MPRLLTIVVLVAVAAGATALIVRARTPARPGVVRLPSGARVADAIAVAGGTTPDADPATLNKAAILRDGARVYVPRYGETPPAGSLGSDSERKVDINHATAAELESG